MKVYVFAQLLMVVLAGYVLSGCVPLVTGIKEYKSGDTTISFITGFDTSASLNGIDTVDNQRGIRPSGVK